MIRRQPRTIRPDTLLPYTTRFRSKVRRRFALQLGASARERLKAAAAARWGVPVSEVIANDSVLIHQASDRKLRYGDVVTDAAKLTLDAEPPLRSEEHTSELQSLMRISYAVFCLKKKNPNQ